MVNLLKYGNIGLYGNILCKMLYGFLLIIFSLYSYRQGQNFLFNFNYQSNMDQWSAIFFLLWQHGICFKVFPTHCNKHNEIKVLTTKNNNITLIWLGTNMFRCPVDLALFFNEDVWHIIKQTEIHFPITKSGFIIDQCSLTGI